MQFACSCRWYLGGLLCYLLHPLALSSSWGGFFSCYGLSQRGRWGRVLGSVGIAGPPQCRYQAATQPQLDFPLGHSYCRCDGNPTPVAFYIKHLVVFSLESPFCICFPVVRKLGSYPSHTPDYKWWSHALYSRCAGLPPPPTRGQEP